MDTLSVTDPFPVPELGLSVNQLALSPAIQLSVPPPVFLMLKVRVPGLVPPCVVAKERLVGLTPMAGGTTGGGMTGGGMIGGGGVTGDGGDPAGMKIARLLSDDSLLPKS